MKKILYFFIFLFPLSTFNFQLVYGDGLNVWTPGGAALSTAPDEQDYPQIVSDGSGGAIICWQDSKNGSWDIYAQAISQEGNVQWTSDGICVSTISGDQLKPVIVSDGDGGAIISWWDGRDEACYGIYSQRVDSSGNFLWQAHGVAVSTMTDVTSSDIVSADIDKYEKYRIGSIKDGSGGAVICWVDERNGNQDIYAQRISQNGVVLWQAHGSSICSNAGHQNYPVIVSDENNGAIIAWHDSRNGKCDIYAVRISSSGTTVWPENQVFSNANGDKPGFTPDCVMCRDGAEGAIICWQKRDEFQLYDIYAQRINGTDGSLLWTSVGEVVCEAGDHQMEPVIVKSNGIGTAVIAWRDFRNESYGDPTYGDVYCERLNSDGSRDWAAIGNGIFVGAGSPYEDTAQEHIGISEESSGGAIICWQDKRTGGQYDIYAQKYDIDAILTWEAEWEGTAVSTFSISGHQQYPQIIDDGIKGAIICWADDRSDNVNNRPDIYIQRMCDPDEDLPQNITTLSALEGDKSDEIKLSWVAPDEDASDPQGEPATYYILKYSTKIPTGDRSDWWNNIANEHEQTWQPLSPGATESKSIYLLSSTTYYFILQVVDDANNTSQIQTPTNVADGVTKEDTDSPSKIPDLSAEPGITEGRINLSWSAPYDNYDSTANRIIITGNYHVQHSTDYTISWSTSDAQVSYPIENESFGDLHSKTLTGLIPGATYYFHIWTEDEVPNVSVLSNRATAWAQVDVTEPGKVTTLDSFQVQGSSISIRLSWLAPGDDGYVNYSTSGLIGFSGEYKIQHSTNDIISPAVSKAQVSISTSSVYPGDFQSKVVSGLEDDTEYYFVLWTYDESNNLSNYSNITSTKTLDLTPPGKITTLSGISGNFEGEVELFWTAPGDNGNEDIIEDGKFRIQHSTWTGVVWSTVSPNIEISTSNVKFGDSQVYLVTGLINGATYYFRIWTCDEVPNWSEISHGATSQAQIDEIAPGKVANLNVTPGDMYATLEWTAPGDNGYLYDFDDCSGYDIRYSSIAAISESTSTWNSLNLITDFTILQGSTIPTTCQKSEILKISGLTNYVKYWFALKTNDEIPNESDISNIVSCIPSEDQNPPTGELIVAPPDKIYILGNKIVVKAKAQDGESGITSIKLCYRKIGGAAFESANMYEGAPEPVIAECSGEIPAGFITADGIQYYVDIRDKAKNWFFSTGEYNVYPPTITVIPHQVEVFKTYTVSVGKDEQTVVLPDGNPDDGETSLYFPASALKEQITVSITQEDVTQSPKKGAEPPVVVFDFKPDGKMFKKPVTMTILYFDLDGDGKVDGTEINEADLKIFLWDGFQWRLTGGSVDNQKNTVSAKLMHFSKYALFQWTGVLDLKDTSPLRKIITPNSDGENDYAEFCGLEPPYELYIHNIRGRIIKSYEDISSPVWDGTDEDGDIVESGIYMYQIKKDGEILSGVIVVAK